MLWSIKRLQVELMGWVRSFPAWRWGALCQWPPRYKGVTCQMGFSMLCRRRSARMKKGSEQKEILDPWFWVTWAINCTGGGKKERGLFSRNCSAVQQSFSQAMSFPTLNKQPARFHACFILQKGAELGFALVVVPWCSMNVLQDISSHFDLLLFPAGTKDSELMFQSGTQSPRWHLKSDLFAELHCKVFMDHRRCS